jgi:hypothetical protein
MLMYAVHGETIFGRCYRFEFIPKVCAPCQCLERIAIAVGPSVNTRKSCKLMRNVCVMQGFMGRLIIRLLAFPLTVQVCWLTGVLASIGRYVPFVSLLLAW